MIIRFKTKTQRDELASRLNDLAWQMIRARDQGSDGKIYPSDKQINDISAASVIVSQSQTDEE